MRLLLDSHLAAVLARQLRDHGVDAVALPEWKGGDYRSAHDELILQMAYADQRVLVTYDLRTIPPLLGQLAETGQHHGGVVLVDGLTFRPNDIGGLLSALQALAASSSIGNWEDRVVFLTKAQGV